MNRRLFFKPHASTYHPESASNPVCHRFSRCEGCPYPAHGFLCWASNQECLRTRMKKINRKEESNADQSDAQYRNTTGFRYETLTDDPEIRKAVDDFLLDFAGEENPRRTCNYGLTEKGLQALRDVADPSIPHTYAWFVMTDCNTPQEELHRDLTLDEAIQLFQDSDRSEKRLGVTKDAFATVDIVRMVDGDQSFFTDYQKLESFKNDPTIFEAVEQVHQELENVAQDQGMTM